MIKSIQNDQRDNQLALERKRKLNRYKNITIGKKRDGFLKNTKLGLLF